jgi:integrase
VLAAHRPSPAAADALLFAGRSGRPFDPSAIYKRADRAWKRARLERMTLHEARHTFASMMAAAGVPIADLSDFMGHTSLNVTMKRYRHLYPDARRTAARAMDEFLGRASMSTRPTSDVGTVI